MHRHTTPAREKGQMIARPAVLWTCALLSAGITGCGGGDNARDAENSLNAGSLERHAMALASDEFQGRKPFTAGETKTVEYLAAEFEKLGLKGANGGSYFQEVPLVEIAGRHGLSPAWLTA